jgi:oligopeptide transport system permease protein
MVTYILRRVLWSIPVLVMVSLLTFGMLHLTSGGPWSAVAGKNTNPKIAEQIAVKFGLDKSLPEQYAIYVWNSLHGDFGLSYVGGQTVSQKLSKEFPVSAALGLTAVFISVFLGIPLGLITALRHNGILDQVTMFFVTLSYSVPSFVIGIFLIIIVCVTFHLTPIAFSRDDPKTWVLPALILSVFGISSVVRLTRSAVLDVMSQDYIRTARAKGLPAVTVNIRHLLRNALIPVVTLLGPLTAGLIAGSFVIEHMFSVPGIGKDFVDAIFQRNYTVFLGVTLLYALIVVFFNLLVDLTYSFLDPRIVRS